MPELSDIKNMNMSDLAALAEFLGLGAPGESYQDTANRLYFSGQDDEAYVFQTMAFQLADLETGAQ